MFNGENYYDRVGSKDIRTIEGCVDNTNAELKSMKTYIEHLPVQVQSSQMAKDHIQVTSSKGLYFISQL